MMELKNLKRSALILGVAIVLSVSARADAAFTVTTAVTGVTYNGVSLSGGSLSANTSYNENGVQFTTSAQGGSFYTDSQGTTVYFVEASRSAVTKSIPNEQFYVINANSSATDTGSFVFSTLIGVTNNAATGTFTEGPTTLSLNLSGGDANYTVFTTNLTPPSQTIGGTLFTASMPQATSGEFNSQANGAISASISATVPEPASLALFGMGAVGIFGVMMRRARKA